MFANNVVTAWEKASRYIKSFSKGDYVFYYKKGYGIIAIGIINSEKSRKIESGLEYDVKILVSPLYDNNKKPLAFISANELKQIINKSIYFASTRKVPFLDEKESKILVDILKNKGH